jgi:DNA-binding MurR/RpiR family transcriptional regulator
LTQEHCVRVSQRIIEVQADLPPAERRVAELVLADSRAVAFGTVASVAKATNTSGPTVVRLASRLGFAGFGELQDATRGEVGELLRPAAERIRDHPVGDAVADSFRADLDNVQRTLDAIDPAAFATAVELLATGDHRVAVLSGDATQGIAQSFAADLGLLRAEVELVSGSAVRVARSLGLLDPSDIVVAIDLRRYEEWVLDAVADAHRVGARTIAITDSVISPVATGALATFVVAAASPGPFDSHVGTLALANALVAATATRLRRSATSRLDRVERAWHRTGALRDPGSRI